MLTPLRLSRHGAASSPRRLLAVIAAGACCGALLVAGAGLEAGAAWAQAQAGSFTVVVTIANSELDILPSTVPAGRVVFNVVNKAKSARDFEIAGKKTPIIGA